MRESAHELFFANYRLESPYPRSVIYAVLGAVEMAGVDESAELNSQLQKWLAQLRRRSNQKWAWPEHKLTYDNARYPEALIAAGRILSDQGAVEEGLALLWWLVDVERITPEGHFNWTPVGGRSLANMEPGFDQQPLEAWAMVDAASVAALVDGSHWFDVAETARSWFLGANDLGVEMVDPETGGGFDGLTPTGPNLNRGAESTLAAVATMSGAYAGAHPA